MASRRRFTDLLAIATVGVYALIIAGATTAITDAAGACPTWPACNGHWLALDTPALAVVWLHRTVAAAVGLLVLGLAVHAWRSGARRRVRWALALSLVFYPVQVAVGAVAAVEGAPPLVANTHLLLGVSIFGALVAALTWTLEDQTADAPTPADARARRSKGEREAGATLTGWRATLYGYYRLTKPRLMWLLSLVAAAGMALAAGPALDVWTVVYTLSGGVLAIGASGTFNHVLERDVDRRMTRTSDRPLPTDRIPPRNAAAFGVALSVASLALFGQVNLLTAALGFTAILYYSVVYTLLLKPNTVQNTVVGGLAGALPALIGWAAVTDRIGLPAVLLAVVIFVWTPAHFYNLALAYKRDYERGGFPMMPVVRGDAVTRKHILGWLGATLVTATALAAVTPLGPLYAATSALFGAVFLWAVVRLHRERTADAAFRAFHASNVYLGAVLVAVVVDALAV